MIAGQLRENCRSRCRQIRQNRQIGQGLSGTQIALQMALRKMDDELTGRAFAARFKVAYLLRKQESRDEKISQQVVHHRPGSDYRSRSKIGYFATSVKNARNCAKLGPLPGFDFVLAVVFK